MLMNEISHMPESHVSDLFSEPFCAWSSEAILRHMHMRESISYFPVIDPQETQRTLIDNIMRNRFEFNQELHVFSEGIPWTQNPSQDREWLILLHKFYFAVGLGMAYEATQDICYAEKWVELTDSWIDTVPLDFHPSDVAGRRIQNWIFAHYYFVCCHSPSVVTPQFHFKFLASLAEQVEHLCKHLTPARNHRTLELCAIFLAGVVFPELRQAPHWLEIGRTGLIDNIRSDFLPDGVHCELSTDYHHLVLKNLLWVRRLASLNQVVFPADFDEKIQHALEFSVYVHKPDGHIPSLSDGDSRNFLNLLEEGYHLYGHEQYRYVAHKGNEGTTPSQRSKGFPDSGYYIMRSGWGDHDEPYEDERYLVVDCGPLGAGNHGHLDLLSVEMAAYGHSLVVDPGRYTYDESGEPNWRVHFRETAAHNTVSIDGKNQTRYVRGKEKFKIKGPEPDHEVKAFITRSEFDFFHGVARSHEYPVIHERRIFFIHHENGPQYWILSDRLVAQERHTYDVRFHLSPLAQQAVNRCFGETDLMVESPHLILAQPYHPDVTFDLENGFVSQTYGEKHSAPIVRFTRQASTACFHTIVMPFKQVKPELSVAIEPVSFHGELCAEEDATCLRIGMIVDGKNLEDLYFVNPNHAEAEYHFLDQRYRGNVFFLRRHAHGQVICQHRINHYEAVDSVWPLQEMP